MVCALLKGCILVGLLQTSAFAVLASPPAGMQTSVAQGIRVSASQPNFSVTMPANRSAGYQWVLQGWNPQLLTLIEHRVVPANSHLIGAPAEEVWQFCAQHLAFQTSQMIPLQFVYKRPWEKNIAQQMTVIVVTTP